MGCFKTFDLFTYLLGRQNSGGSPSDFPEVVDIVYQDNEHITLVDNKGVEHAMVIVYTNGFITNLAIDGENIEVVYDNENNIITVDGINIDISNYNGKAEEWLSTFLTFVNPITNTMDSCFQSLTECRNILVTNLNAKGVIATLDETLTQLASQIDDIVTLPENAGLPSAPLFLNRKANIRIDRITVELK